MTSLIERGAAHTVTLDSSSLASRLLLEMLHEVQHDDEGEWMYQLETKDSKASSSARISECAKQLFQAHSHPSAGTAVVSALTSSTEKETALVSNKEVQQFHRPLHVRSAFSTLEKVAKVVHFSTTSSLNENTLRPLLE